MTSSRFQGTYHAPCSLSELQDDRFRHRTKKIKYLEENMGAVDVHLEHDENAAIRKLIEATEIHGQRAPEGYAHSRSYLLSSA